MSDLAPTAVKPVDRPLQKEAGPGIALVQVDALVRASDARTKFGVDGRGMTVAVLDTGLRTTHADFAGRVAAQRNFTAEHGGNPDNATDDQGHGTNVAGIICAGAINKGMAPGARVLPIKVLDSAGGGSFKAIADALDWVRDNRTQFDISAVCMSLGASDNWTTDETLAGDRIGVTLGELTNAGVVCCVAAGNSFHGVNSKQGMSYPAIFRQTISVGAVYDSPQPPITYASGAAAYSIVADQITPFSQRLSAKVGQACATDIFAPGAPTTSSGYQSDNGLSVQQGTSQATPVIAGVTLLLQHYYRRSTGDLPSVEQVRSWLAAGATQILDGDDEVDNVEATHETYLRVSALGALTACARDIMVDELVAAGCVSRTVERIAAE